VPEELGSKFELSELQEKIALGLIGCGSIAQESHVPAIAQIPSARIVAVADSDSSKARTVQKKLDSVKIYEDYRQLLRDDEVDAVDICTPTKYHSEIVVAAANSGKHVLCEKPIALTLEDADRMINACAENRVKLMIAHSRRFIPRNSIAKRLIREGRIGKPIWGLQISRRGMAEPGSWYFDPAMTYGPIAEVGIHDADLLRWFFDDEVVEVIGTGKVRESISPLYNQVLAILKFKHGPVASFEVGYVLPKGYAQYTTLELMGSKGFVSAADNQMNVVVKAQENGVTYPLAYSDMLSVSNAYRAEIEAFLNSIILDKAPPVSGQDARAALEIVLAVLESIKRRGPVRLPL
jgi:predicted dehydrogenase